MAYIEGDDEARAAVQAEIRSALGQARTGYVVTQAESAEFLLANGAAVLSGHAPVGEPGRQGDPDVSPDAADSRG